MPNDVAFADNTRLARNATPAPRITRIVKAAVDHILETGAAYNQAAEHSRNPLPTAAYLGLICSGG